MRHLSRAAILGVLCVPALTAPALAGEGGVELGANDKKSLDEFEGLYKKYHDDLQAYAPKEGEANETWIASAKRLWSGYKTKMLLPLRRIRDKNHPDVAAAQKKLDEWPAVVDRKALDWQKLIGANAGAAAAVEAQKEERAKLIAEAMKPFERFNTCYEGGTPAGTDGAYLAKITPDQQKAWLDGFKAVKAEQPASLAKLEKAATMPQGSDPGSLAEHTEWLKNLPASIDQAVEAHKKAIAAYYARFIQAVEPAEKWKDDGLLDDLGFFRAIEKIEGAIRMTPLVALIEKDWNGKDGKEQDAEIARYKAWIDGLQTARKGAITRVRLPADIADAELRKLAEDAFARTKRTVRRFAVLSKIEKKDTGEWYKGAWVPLVWESFKVMTVEKDQKGSWRLHHMFVRKNHKGWQEWPMGVWTIFLDHVTEGALILEENIDK